VKKQIVAHCLSMSQGEKRGLGPKLIVIRIIGGIKQDFVRFPLLIKERYVTLEPLWKPIIIRIQKGDECVFSFLDSRIACSGNASIHCVSNHPHPRTVSWIGLIHFFL